MSDIDGSTALQACLDRLAAGDVAARDELIERACGRLRTLTRQMLQGDRVRRWEDTDDVLQRALMKIHAELARVRPDSLRDFLRFSSFHIRRELSNLGRHYFRKHGLGANHSSNVGFSTGQQVLLGLTSRSPDSALTLAEQWQQLHTAIDQLPDESRELVELLWLQGLTATEVADVLGVTSRTVRRRWAKVRIDLATLIDDATSHSQR